MHTARAVRKRWSRILVVVLAVGGSLATRASATSWSPPVQPPAGCGSTPSGAPSLAVNATGGWAVAGYAQTGTGLQAFSVEVCTSPDGVHWSGPVTLGQGVAPAVAVGADGRTVAIWQGGPSTSPDVQASVRAAGGGWSVPTTVSTLPGHPLLAMDGTGNAWGRPSPSASPTVASIPCRWRSAATAWRRSPGPRTTATAS